MMKFHRLALVAATAVPSMARAAPPPPPPDYVYEVGKLLTGNESAETLAKLSSYLAEDVREYVNGKLVADGKPKLTQYQGIPKISRGRIVSFSEGWKDGGTLMIVDEYDTVDRSKLPPRFLADPRPDSRATLYQFGRDGKIHSIQTLVASGFWVVQH